MPSKTEKRKWILLVKTTASHGWRHCFGRYFDTKKEAIAWYDEQPHGVGYYKAGECNGFVKAVRAKKITTEWEMP